MSVLRKSIFLIVPVLICHYLIASDTIHYEYWDINNLENIGGHSVVVLGNPQVESTDIGDAIRFDGDGDQLMVDFNPVADATEFTVELVFKPDACYPNNVDPRFLHMQDPNDPDEKRVMIELRIDANNQVYIDGFMKTDLESLALIDATLVHATQVWQHAAITYKDSIFTTYFNGVKELSGKVGYTAKIINTLGKTSLGARMNERKYYAGLMKFLKVSHAVLDPDDFIFIHDQPASGRQTEVFYKFGDIEIFPNPVDMELKLSVGDISSGTTVELSVIDPSGKVLYNHKSEPDNDNIIRVNTAEFQEGVYLVSLRSDERIDCGRIVILH